MRFSRPIGSIRWTHAFGELLLIVVGISLALMANSWYGSCQELKYEKFILQQIEISMEEDLMKLKNNYKKLLVSEKDLDKLLQLIRSRDLTTADSDTMYAAVKLWLGNVRMRRAVYEELKNRGFSIIRDVSIRSKIIDVYEDLQPALQSTTTVDSEFSKEQILPYYRARFHIVNQDMCVPIDRARTLRDPIYENIVVEKLTRLRHRLLPRYEELISAIEEVCIDINQQIRL